ncbi:MAG: NYN domain-containing protein [Gammaproteobacteria bacterium]|nr:NYN domain-containing protein [Gammaproteobacteria bacterium]
MPYDAGNADHRDVPFLNQPSTRRTALLIDAENISHRHAPQILRIAKSVGSLELRKAYGDFDRIDLQSWRESMRRHDIRPHSDYCYTTEKNSADQALIDDAGSLLGTGRFQAFVIASADSDFTEVVRRIAAAGAAPYGVGGARPSAAYRRALRRYFELPHIPTIKQFRDAVFDYQRRDPTSHNADVPVDNLRSMMFHLNRVSTVARDYGLSDFAALLQSAGFEVSSDRRPAIVRLGVPPPV